MFSGKFTASMIMFSIILSGIVLYVDNGGSATESAVRRIDHSPISVDGNSDMLSQASMEGWPGTGAPDNPVILSGYTINAQGNVGIDLRNIDLHVRIDDMNITNSDPVSIRMVSCSNIEVSNCLTYYLDREGILVESSHNCTVHNNTLTKQDVILIGRNGISVVDSHDIRVADNVLARMINDGISVLGSSSRVTVSDNTLFEISNNAIIVRTDGNMIRSNQVRNSGWAAKITGDGNTVEKNWMRLNSYGVYISEGKHNLVRDNRFNRNYIGASIVLAVENTVVDNYIGKSASYGIQLYTNADSNNVVHSNHLYYNNETGSSFDSEKVQASDYRDGNIWYDQETQRGNYWHDWTGKDYDGDGVGDLSYPVAGEGSRDLYPLTNPSLPDAFKPPWRITKDPQSTYIDIGWQAPFYGMGVDVISYLIYRSERSGGEFYIDTVPGDQLTYRDHDVVSGRAYYYYIIALNDLAYSNRSRRVKSSPDTKAPSVSITDPEEGDIFATTSVRVLYEGSDNIAIDRFEVSLDGGEPVNKGPWQNITYIGLSEGYHTVEVTIFDLAEHNRTDSVTFLIDITAPVISIDNPGGGTTISSSTSPTVTWEGFDSGSGIGGYQISLDGSDYSSVGIVTSYRFIDLEPGPHTLWVRAEDLAGNGQEDSINITVDPNAPSLNIVRPVNYYVNSTGDILMRWYGNDLGTGVEGYAIRWGQEDWIDLGNITSYRVTGLQEGSHTIYLRIFDRAGNNNTQQRIVTVDMTPPLLEMLVPVDGGRYSEPFNLEYSSSDLLSGLERTRIKLDDGEWKTYTPEDVVRIGPLENGVHSVIVEVEDTAGNSVTDSRSFIYDISQPRVEEIFPTGDSVYPNATLRIVFSEPMERDSVVLDVEGIEGNISWDDRNLTLIPDSPLVSGKQYSLRITGSDLAGNSLVPFDWSFTVRGDPDADMGTVKGNVMDTSGSPVSNATVRFRTGERTETDQEGRFEQEVHMGSNHVVISAEGYMDNKVDFQLDEGQVLDLGDIPLKVEQEEEEEDEKGSSLVIIIVIVSVIVAVLIAVLIAFQIKKTRDYAKQPAIPDEWVNGRSVPLKEQMRDQMGPADEGINR